MYWSSFSLEEINRKFVAPLLTSLASVDLGDLNDVSRSTDKIIKLIVDCSLPLVTPRVNHRRHGSHKVVELMFPFSMLSLQLSVRSNSLSTVEFNDQKPL